MVRIQSDHQPLRWLMNLKTLTGCLAWGALSLQAFNFHFDYIPWKRNVIADTLSRPPLSDTDETELVNMVSTDFPTKAASDIRREQLADVDLQKIIIESEALEPGVDFKTCCERGYIMVNSILHRYASEIDEEEPQQVVPKSQIPDVFKEYHDSELAGHQGIERTYQRIVARYYLGCGGLLLIMFDIASCVNPSSQLT